MARSNREGPICGRDHLMRVANEERGAARQPAPDPTPNAKKGGSMSILADTHPERIDE
jgi:hypothetical protein